MSQRSTLAHFLHDAGLAVWFGGSLTRATSGTATAGGPVEAAAVGAHLLGGALILRDNKTRVRRQKGVLANTNAKLALTAAALGATGYTRGLAKKAETDPQAAERLKALQWAVPGLTGAVLASSSLHEEQQRPTEVLRGTLRGAGSRAAEVAAPLAALASARALSAAHAAGPALEKARDAAGPAFEKARDAAGPAFEKARDAAGPALEKARDAAAPAMHSARDTAVPALERALDAAAPAAHKAAERIRDAVS